MVISLTPLPTQLSTWFMDVLYTKKKEKTKSILKNKPQETRGNDELKNSLNRLFLKNYKLFNIHLFKNIIFLAFGVTYHYEQNLHVRI